MCGNRLVSAFAGLILGLYGLNSPLWALSPPQYNIKPSATDNGTRLLSYRTIDGGLYVKVRTVDGIHRFALRQREAMSADQPKIGITMFQGMRLDSMRQFGTSPRAAASIFRDKLSVNFLGKRKARSYEVVYDLTTSQTHSFRVSRHNALACASGAAISATSSAPFGTSASSTTYRYSPNRYLQISVEADFEFYSLYGGETAAQMLSILNAAEAIYLDQLGISFALVSLHQFSTPEENYVSSDASQLLEEFRDYSESNRQLKMADVYHLFTGKHSDDGIAGLAYVGPVCRENSYSYGLSRKVNSAIQPLVTAHEIGHGLSATHPEDSLTSPAASLMSGLVRSGQDRFSDFSLEQITSHLDRYDPERRCLSGLGFSVTARSVTGARYAQTLFTTRSQGGDSCTATLYGSASRSRLSTSNVLSRGVALAEFDLGVSQRRLYARFRNGVSRTTAPLYFRVYADCDGLIYVSSIKREHFHGYGGSRSRRASAALPLIRASIR